MTLDDDLLRLGEVPAGTAPIRPLGQIRLRADELRRSRRRRTLAGGSASVAGVGVVTLLVTGLPGTLLSSAPTPDIGVGAPRAVPPCELDPTSTATSSGTETSSPTSSGDETSSGATSSGAPASGDPTSGDPTSGTGSVAPVPPTGPPPGGTSGSLIVTSQPGDPTSSGTSTSQPGDAGGSTVATSEPPAGSSTPGQTVVTATATPVPPDPGVPWSQAPKLLHLVGTQRPVEARLDAVPPVDCRYLPPTVALGVDRGPAGSVRAVVAVDGPWLRRPDLPQVEQQVAVRGTRGTVAHWRAEVLDSRGVLVLAWLEPRTHQWWQVRSSGLSRQELLALANGLDLARPAAGLPKRFTALPVQKPTTRASHRWEVIYRAGRDDLDVLSVWDGPQDDGPLARLADIQADRVRLVDVAGGLAFWLPHDNGDSPAVYLVRDGLTFQYLSTDYPGSVKALKAIEHVTADDPRLKGVPRWFP